MMAGSFARYKSPLGDIILASDGKCLTGLWFDGQKNRGGILSGSFSEAELPVFREAKRWLDVYFGGHAPDFTPPIKIDCAPFMLSVLEVVLKIPYGSTKSYGEIAEELAAQKGIPRMSAQAVGGALAHNPILLIVPCHRVIGKDGSLTGYAGGIERKKKLIEMERG